VTGWPPRAVDPVVEVDRIRRRNIEEWIDRHGLEGVTVDLMLERIAQVGEEIAAAEARSGVLRVGSKEDDHDDVS